MSSVFREVTATISPASSAEIAISRPNPVEQPDINHTKGGVVILI